MKTCTATIANNNAATAATALIQEGMTRGTLTSPSEAAHKPAPPPKRGPLGAGRPGHFAILLIFEPCRPSPPIRPFWLKITA